MTNKVNLMLAALSATLLLTPAVAGDTNYLVGAPIVAVVAAGVPASATPVVIDSVVVPAAPATVIVDAAPAAAVVVAPSTVIAPTVLAPSTVAVQQVTETIVAPTTVTVQAAPVVSVQQPQVILQQAPIIQQVAPVTVVQSPPVVHTTITNTMLASPMVHSYWGYQYPGNSILVSGASPLRTNMDGTVYAHPAFPGRNLFWNHNADRWCFQDSNSSTGWMFVPQDIYIPRP